MAKTAFRRKIYDEMVKWKVNGNKINPLEVKSGNYRGHKSLDIFCDKFSNRIKNRYIVYTKDYKWENGINYLPVYMIPFL